METPTPPTPAPGTGPDEPRYIVFYDGVCVLCQTGIKQLMRLDTRGQFHYAQLQGETAQSYGIEWDNSVPASEQTLMFVDHSSGQPIVYERMRAVRAALETAGRLKPLSWLLRVVPLPLSNAIYRVIAGTRYRLWGTYDVCPMPPADVRARFLP